MKLGLSSAAARDLSLRELLQVCERRGLAGVELVAGDEHGLRAGSPAAALVEAASTAASLGTRILGYAAATGREALSQDAACLSALLDAPVLAAADTFGPEEVRRAAELYGAAGGRLVLVYRSDPDAIEAARAVIECGGSASLSLGWSVRPGVDDLGAARHVIDAAGECLAYVRLHGGGPEAASQTGHGIGALMGRLTLARYNGPLVLMPSTVRYQQAWTNWLRRSGGWGCGSKTADGTLVQISA
jgi:sugar phosphate isomerase/epimerase